MAFLRVLAVVAVGAAALFVTEQLRAEIVDYNLIVAGNLQSTSQVQGRAIIGGNLTGSASNYGVGLTPPEDYSDIDSLIVGGTLSASDVNVSAGDVRLAGTRGSTNVGLNGPGSQLFENDSSVSSLVSQAVADMTSASAAYANLAVNSTVTQSGSTYTFEVTPGADGIAVFEIDAANFNDPNAVLNLSLAGAPAGTTVIINAVGQIGATFMGNFGGDFLDPSVRTQLLWNFNDQTADVMFDREWWGSVLFPSATLESSSAINGSVYVGGDFIQNGEVRLGFSPAAVPEPSSVLLLSMLGAGAVGMRYCRTRHRPTDCQNATAA